jgi:hypothetical protein
MGLMAHLQRKSIEAAQKVLGDEAQVIDQANTFSGPNPMLVGLGLLVVFVLIFAVTRILIGGLIILAVANSIRKPRNLVLTNRGLALFRSSITMARPSELLGTFATSDLTTNAGPAQLGYVPVQLNPERVWIRNKDRTRFLGTGQSRTS